MRFLGGLLKFFSILLLLAGTVVCAAVISIEGFVNGYEEAYWVMGAVWIGVVILGLTILGAGIALTQTAKLKNRVAALEKRAVSTPVMYSMPTADNLQAAPAAVPATPSAPDPISRTPDIPVEKKETKKPWLIPVIAGGAAVLVVIAILLIAPGNKKIPVQPEAEQPAQMQEQTPVQNQEAVETEPTGPVEGERPNTAGQAAVELFRGDSIEHPDFVMTFEGLELADEFKYRTSDYSSTSLYVEPGYKLLMAHGHFENRGTSTIETSMFHLTALVNDSYLAEGYDVRLDFLRSTSFEIDPYTDMDFVLYLNIPEKLAEMFETVTFTLGFNEDFTYPTTVWESDGSKHTETDLLYSYTDDLEGVAAEIEAAKPENTPIALGETIVTDEYEFTLKRVEMVYQVLPPDTGSVYTSYTADSGKVFINVVADVKNTMQRDIRIDELFTASALYDGKYPYKGFTAVVDGGNQFDWVGSYVAATPLETVQAHHIIECPAEVDESGKPVEITLHIGGVDYSYQLR